MKKLVLVFGMFSAVALFPGCAKKDNSCTPKSVQSEAVQMQAYATANGITPTVHSSGIYYEIIDPGTGATASATSKIVITYTGKFMNGEKFDEMLTPNTNQPWSLNGLIQGWVIGIPLVKKGGHIKLLIPSSLAYGCAQYYTIPGNSVLFFDVHLVDVL